MLPIYIGKFGVNPTSEQLGAELLGAVDREASIESIRNLIDRGANVNMARNDGPTPLLVACSRNHPEIATLLIEGGADVDLSLLKVFVRQDEEVQIDAIINNVPQEPIQLHLYKYADTGILDLLHFPAAFDGAVHLIGYDGNPIELHFEPAYLLK